MQSDNFELPWTIWTCSKQRYEFIIALVLLNTFWRSCLHPGGEGAERHLPRHPGRPRQAPHPLQVKHLPILSMFLSNIFQLIFELTLKWYVNIWNMLKKPKRISTHPNLLSLYHRSSGQVYWISPFLGIKLGQFLCERSITCTPNSNPFWTQYLQWKCDVYIQWNAKRMHGNVTKYMLDVNVGFFKKSQELFF